MLRHLSITNYAIIEKVDISFANGFTVITGETGAGKSILLGALSLILGKRADTSVFNNKNKKCFEKDVYADFFNNNDLDYEEINTIRREINVSGKSRAFINDTPVSLNTLKELTSYLVDIHSQHQTLTVIDTNFQIKVLDSFSGINNELSDYAIKYRSYNANKYNLIELKNKARNAKTDLDYISFQVKEIEDLGLKLDLI